MFRRIIIVFLTSIMTWAAAQSKSRDYDEELDYQNSAIKDLKTEIARTRKRLENESGKVKSLVRKISDIEEEISLLSRLINELEKEEYSTKKTISNLEEKIKENETELKLLRDRYRNRVIRTYKRGTLSPLEKILSSTSWRQAVYRGRYIKIISDIDSRTQARIKALMINVGKNKLAHENALRKTLALSREQVSHQQTLNNRKKSKKRELDKVKKNTKNLKSYLAEKEEGLKQLEEVRKKVLEDKARFERAERIRKQQEALRTKKFSELEGKLSWPTEGRVVTKFGNQWNAKLKTTTESPGIDIEAKPGTEIRTVLNGIVTTITYIRGYGTTIIVDHGGGFYTVYSHVTNIQTNIDSEVRAGDIIAYMGDSGSVSGAKLHFEIWGKGRKLNPEKWLHKK